MHKSFLIILVLLVSATVWSQQPDFKKPEYEIIRKKIFDSSSAFFYPDLYDRYQYGDTSLTLEDFRHLYFGYTFHSKYIPYQESKFQSEIISYLKKGTLSTDELNDFIEVAELNLKDLPFDIRTLHILANSYKLKNDSLMRSIAEFKKNMVIKAILSTGNGKSEQSAFHVIDPSHEYDILNESGFRYAGTSDLANALCDYLIVQPNEKNIRGYYFDISRLLQVKAERQ